MWTRSCAERRTFHRRGDVSHIGGGDLVFADADSISALSFSGDDGWSQTGSADLGDDARGLRGPRLPRVSPGRRGPRRSASLTRVEMTEPLRAAFFIVPALYARPAIAPSSFSPLATGRSALSGSPRCYALRQRILGWRSQPRFDLGLHRQYNRHGLGVNRLDLGVRLWRADAAQLWSRRRRPRRGGRYFPPFLRLLRIFINPGICRLIPREQTNDEGEARVKAAMAKISTALHAEEET
jgi:hypothetical protein